MNIPGANSRTYTVVADDAEAYLVARVSYTDAPRIRQEMLKIDDGRGSCCRRRAPDRAGTVRHDHVDGRIDRAEASRAVFNSPVVR